MAAPHSRPKTSKALSTLGNNLILYLTLYRHKKRPVQGFHCSLNGNIDVVKRIACFISLVSLVCIAHSQTYTERLRKQETSGEGRVVIIQDAAVEDVVNNVKRNRPEATPKKSEPTKETPAPKNYPPMPKEGSSTERISPISVYGTRYRTKASGYRIQIFTGGNSHNDKAHAIEMAEKCRKLFPELSVYPRFVSPRWICRVGDFRTHEDAVKYAGKIRAKRITTEVRIVKCEVLLPL